MRRLINVCLLIAAALLICSPAHAQYIYMLTGLSTQFGSVQNPAVQYGTIGGGLADVEVDYQTHLYYYPNADGFLFVNNQLVSSVFGAPGDTNTNGCYFVGGTGGWCQPLWQSFPQPIAYSTTYEVQLNGYVIPYYTYVQSNVTYYDDYFGYSTFLPGNYGGSTDQDANPTCYADTFLPNPVLCAATTGPIYVDSLYAGIVTPPGGPLVPVVSGIQVNGVPTNTIVAGTSGYIAIYGTNMTGATTVGLPPGISLSSFAVYNNGTQINAFFMAQVSAGTGSHNITVTTPGGTSATSSASSALTVAITLKSFSFSNGVPYSRDCPGAASPISAPTWPSPTGVTCPQKSPYLGDHAVYASGAVMTGTVNFSVAPAPSQAVPGMYIQGVIPGVGNFTATGVAMAANSTTFSAAVKANAALPSSKTQFYNPMSVAWSVGQSGNSCSSGCVSLGSSSNPVYVTLAPSIVSPKVSPIMLTYVALAVAAGGATTPQTALANTWAKFSTGSGPANVSTWDGRLMFYYVPGVGFNACVTVATLLVETNGIPANNLTSGQCGAFAALLEDSLSINGIASTWLNITSIDGSKMVVKAWTASNISYPSQAPWEYKLLLGTSDYMVPVPIGGFGDLADINGIAGQNSAQPSEKVFDAHFIVQPTVPSAQDYDPSYGVTYATAATFELNSEFGYAKQMNGDTSGHYHVRPAVVAPYAVNVQFTPIAGNSIP